MAAGCGEEGVRGGGLAVGVRRRVVQGPHRESGQAGYLQTQQRMSAGLQASTATYIPPSLLSLYHA